MLQRIRMRLDLIVCSRPFHLHDFLPLAYQGIEEKLECAVSLAPKLSSEPDKNHLALAMFSRDHRCFLG